MPFDGTYFQTFLDLTELQPGKAGLRQLAYLLRHPEKWSSGHVWNFREVLGETRCGTMGCAIGIAKLQWGTKTIDQRWYGPWTEIDDIFDGGEGVYDCPDSQVTPTMVADAIDFFLATGHVPTGGEANP